MPWWSFLWYLTFYSTYCVLNSHFSELEFLQVTELDTWFISLTFPMWICGLWMFQMLFWCTVTGNLKFTEKITCRARYPSTFNLSTVVESKISTIVVRGATESYMDDIERAIDDGVNTYKGIHTIFWPRAALCSRSKE